MIQAATTAELQALVARGRWGHRILSPDRKSVIKPWTFSKNAITNVGLDYLLDVALSGGSQLATWYAGLINGSSATLAAGDTAGSHGGWTENTSYSETIRETWGEGGVSSQTITNATAMEFTASGSITVYGAFLISNSTKGGSTGTLFSTGAFASPASLVIAQVLQVTYTATMANA